MELLRYKPQIRTNPVLWVPGKRQNTHVHPSLNIEHDNIDRTNFYLTYKSNTVNFRCFFKRIGSISVTETNFLSKVFSERI